MMSKQISQKALKSAKSSINHLQFENSAYNTLQIDKSCINKPRPVSGYFYSEVQPTPRKNPRIISYSQSALDLLDIDGEQLVADKKNHEILAGNIVPDKAKPIANCYCGYQFGVWAGQLGDGRAISLGDIRNSNQDLQELQLKGSGLTPFSRHADGNAVLRSSIREFLCSEYMHALGIPTTRAGTIVLTDDETLRDLLYNGNVISEKCAVVLRIAPSFLRFGSFEICNKGGPSQDKGKEMIPQLWDFVVNNYYREFKQEDGQKQNQSIFQEIVRRTAETVALWQAYGFCHGVLNTDNMNYGPFGFMEYFDKNHICNHSDKEGRYSYKNQPSICKWNLFRLSEALSPVIQQEVSKAIINEKYDEIYNQVYYQRVLQKLGFYVNNEQPLFHALGLQQLVDVLFQTMDECGSEFTKIFLQLRKVDVSTEFEEFDFTPEDQQIIDQLVSFSAPREVYLEKRKPLVSEDQAKYIDQIWQQQPNLLLMRGITRQFIDDQLEQNKKHKLLVNQDPFQRQGMKTALWQNWLSIYKIELQKYKTQLALENMPSLRDKQMEKMNPIYCLKNSVAQFSIEAAEKGDFKVLNLILQVLQNPFIHQDVAPDVFFTSPLNCNQEICVSCSS